MKQAAFGSPRRRSNGNQRNRKDRLRIVVDGVSKLACEWEEVTGIPCTTITRRIKQFGWSHKEAVTKPIREWDKAKDYARYFLSKVNRSGANGCWLWLGKLTSSGYGRLWYRGHGMQAHRFSWVHTNGAIPDGQLHVLHRCDVRACVNPAHLFLGTQRENMDDMMRKGRSKLGWATRRRNLANGSIGI